MRKCCVYVYNSNYVQVLQKFLYCVICICKCILENFSRVKRSLNYCVLFHEVL